jgi:hypothetical protein
LIRDTFELNPGLAELFKRKMLEIAKEVGFPEDLIDFESHIDMKGTYGDNLRIFYREYPRLSERSDFLKKNPIRELSKPQTERAYRAYQISQGQTPEPVIAVTNQGHEVAQPTTEEPIQPSYPTLSFNYSVNSYSKSSRDPRTEPESAVQEPEPSLSIEDRLGEVVLGSTHFLIVGKKDEGKSALGCHLLDMHRGSRSCYVYRPPRPDLLPTWIKPISNMDELPNNAVCMIDETPKEFDQYSYRKLPSKYVAELMRLARHKNQSFIIIAQNSTDVNRNFMFPIDVYLLKEPSMFQRIEERKIIKSAYERIKEPIHVNEFYWYDSEIFMKTTFEKPDYYSEEFSHNYKDNSPLEPERPELISETKQQRITPSPPQHPDDGLGLLFAFGGFLAGGFILQQGLLRHLTLQAYGLGGLFIAASVMLVGVIIHKKLLTRRF